jgi:hypothetical protein
MPASASAFCSTSAPATVTGAMAPASVKGVMQTIWLRADISMMPSSMGGIELQRRVGVDDREERRLAFQLLVRDAARDAGDLDSVLDALCAQRIGMERLVGQDRHVAQCIEMADGSMEIDGLHRIARDEADALKYCASFRNLR